jgi:hypothetical protein
MTMDYLITDSGYLFPHAIVLIERVQKRGEKFAHRVHYQIGGEARETFASDSDVDEFLQ